MAKKQNFLQGAAVLAVGVALVKLIGAVFKIPLQNLLDGTGSGHFGIAYDFYNVLLVMSTAGLPVAISKMVAESRARSEDGDVSRIIKAGMSTFIIIGFIGSLLMFIYAQQIAAYVKSDDSVYAIRIIAPAAFFVALMSVFRGYYQGMTDMYPTGISQVIEALSKLVFGLAIAYYLRSMGYGQEIQAAGAIAGVTIGTVLGALFLILRWVTDKSKVQSGNRSGKKQSDITYALLAIAIPITISSGVLAVTNLIDSVVVMKRLQEAAGFTEELAVWTKGSYTLAQTLFNFPSAFIVPFAVSIVPAVASALSIGDNKSASRTIETGIRIVSLLALPAALGLSVLSGPILNLLFFARAEEVAVATTPLSILGIVVFFNCVVMMSNATLQSIGKAKAPVFTMLAGCIVKIATNWVLVGTPSININGAPIGTAACYLTIMVLNLIIIARNIKPAPNIISMFLRPFLASLVMAGAAWAFNGIAERFIGGRIAVLLAIAGAAIVYLVLAILLRAVTRSDLEMLPKGDKIANILHLK